jgi:hypothetical protein
MWFTSGIAMIYAGGMPVLAADERLRRLPPLDLRRVRLSPLEAATRAGALNDPEPVVLLTIVGRPAYRFGGVRPVTVFADTGDILHAVASSFKQHSAEGGFQFLEALTECGLLDAATACCAREVAFAGCGQKIGYLLR